MTTEPRAAIPWASMAATAVLWGSAFPAIRIALPDYTPASIAVLRIAVALVLLVPCLALGRVGRLRRDDAVRMAAFGVTGMTAYQLLLYTGEQSVEGGTAALLITASPVFATLLGIAFLRERPGGRGVAGLVIALCGAVLVAVTTGGGSGTLAGAAAIILAAATQATSFILQKPLLNRYSGVECTFYGSLFGLVPMLPLAPSALAQAATAQVSGTAAVVWLGLACTVLAFWTWSRTLRTASAATSSLVLYGVPVAALALDAALLHVLPAPTSILGGVLVLTGITVAAFRRTAFRRTASRTVAQSPKTPTPPASRPRDPVTEPASHA
ncbi:DMT family transporter [Streptomyces yunnanensis]|uniref:Permease of the drug/metabolite transporter (DMT) superfamily n=1 Tax=Streptomyces yunnanensis TaxID=156453 RepID=A0A9X8QNM2_9ACTN|nr:DMT family transporter [Streptomyces yunnanensis]SHK96174.1 Permease of the drug/metabolite transporter (DMT) superfamily [Streptomyces yunnanensis]